MASGRPIRNNSAYVAACLATASAAVSAYWAIGGTALLDTVGGEFERLARQRDRAALVLIVVVIAAKLVAAALIMATTRWPATLRTGRIVGVTNRLVGIGLTLYGGLLVISGALVLTGGIHSDSSTDRHALRWHVGLWDLWFLVWGVSTMRAARRYRRVLAPPDHDPDDDDHGNSGR
jgi:hypothetical protein